MRESQIRLEGFFVTGLLAAARKELIPSVVEIIKIIFCASMRAVYYLDILCIWVNCTGIVRFVVKNRKK